MLVPNTKGIGIQMYIFISRLFLLLNSSKDLVKGFITIQMEMFILGTGKMINFTVLEFIYSKMVKDLKGNFKMDIKLVKENISILTEIVTKGNG